MTDNGWNDKAIDVLHERLGLVEDFQAVLNPLPERVANLKDSLDQIRVAQRDAALLAERRDAENRTRFEKLTEDMTRRFNTVDQANDRQRGIDWKTVLAVITGVVAPIVGAIILAGH
jgi:hypothetical protein